MVSPQTLRTHVTTDLEHGGRWTSLRHGGRQWLWSRDEPRRQRVAAGDQFADAGGIEECIPTVRGVPDHGAAWSRAWHMQDDHAVVECGDFQLRRRIRTGADDVTADYRLTATPGFRFIWAAHALLNLSQDARLDLPRDAALRIYPDATSAAATFRTGRWPDPARLRLDRLGPDDGTAIGIIALDCANVGICDGGDRLEMRLTTAEPAPVSIAMWRNLGGYPAERPYRSIGVEPMLGSVFDLAHATATDAVTVGRSGLVQWQLRITSRCPV